jgi:hypothetical protein
MSKLMERNLHAADYARQVFRVNPPAGTTLDEMLEPDYWAHVARRMTPHDTVEVVPEDGSFFARLFVVNADKLWVKMAKIEYVEFGETTAAKVPPSEKFEAKFAGPNAKWRIHNKSDNSLVSNDSFQSRAEAEKWIEQHSKAMAA